MLNRYESINETSNIKEFILLALANKYLYIASIIICLFTAYMVNNYSTVIYEVNSTIGPVDDRRSSLLRGTNNLFGGLGAFSDSRNLANDIASLKSFTLVGTTLNDLNMEVGYYRERTNFLERDQQLYPYAPVRVTVDKSHIQPVNVRFYVNILSDSTFRLICSAEKVPLYNYVDNITVRELDVLMIDDIYSFSETINNEYFKFSISLNREHIGDEINMDGFYFELYNIERLTLQYLKRLIAEPANVKSSLINVYFRGENLNLSIAFLNRYLSTYLNDNLAKKNKIAYNTINFIDAQISEISDSLLLSESQLKDFRSTYQVTDLSYQGQQALEQMTQIETERSRLQIQERYYNYILDYFNKNEDMAGLAPPSAANVVDPIMNQLIMELLSLNAQRSNILSNNTEKNLFLGQIENQIRLQKRAIIENVSNNLNTVSLTQNELNYRAEKLSREISNLPRTELNMVSMQRKFNLSDAIYTFLLQKRSEAAITMASNNPDYEILEPARRISRAILSPKRKVNWLFALFMALVLPSVFILLKKYFNIRITSINDIKHFTEKPVLGVIYSNYYKTEAVVAEHPASSLAESFRNLRSSLFLKLDSQSYKIILVTSSQPQDGKSFVSFNLAASIAAVGYKTIIMDCDLRRPTLHTKFRKDNLQGLSNFMVNHTSKEDIVHNTFVKDLFFIPAGPLLPNPSELIESGKIDELIEFLKNKYEYIILDTTPAGIVADATLLMKYVNQILLVCRNNYTRRDVFNDVINRFNTNNIENFDIIFNDLNIKKSYYGHYDNYFNREKQKTSPNKKIKEVKEETA